MLAVTHPPLTQTESQTYKGLLTAAFDRATAFRGLAGEYEALMAALLSVDGFLRDKTGRVQNQEAEIVYANALGFGDLYTIDRIMGHAVDQAYGALTRLEHLDDILQVLSLKGVAIEYTDDVLVLTNDTERRTGESDEAREPGVFRRQPRLALLVNLLSILGVEADELKISVSKTDDGKSRRMPYVIVTVPSLGRQVAICDQYGETTFVSQTIEETGFWSLFSKNELKATDGIDPVPFTMNWALRLSDLLTGTPADPEKINALWKKLDDANHFAKPDLDFDTIYKAIEAYRLDHNGRLPSRSSEASQYFGYTTNWNTIDMALIHGLRGLKADKEKHPEVNSLAGFIDMFFIRPTILIDMSIEDMKGLIGSYYDVHGEYPTTNSTQTVQFQGRDYKWTAISASIYNTVHTKEGAMGKALEPYPAVIGLGSFIDQFFDRILTINKIVEAVGKYHQRFNVYPVGTSEDDASEYIGLPLSWKNIHERIVRSNGRALSKELEAYPDIRGLGSLMDHFFDRRLTVQKIKDGITAYHAEHGRIPTNRDGDATPYFKNKYSWEAIRLSIYQRIGLMKEALADYPEIKGIPSFVAVLMPELAKPKAGPKPPRP